MSLLPQTVSEMQGKASTNCPSIQTYRCCFIPPYILKAIANSDAVDESCRAASQHALEASQKCHEHRHDLSATAYVGSSSRLLRVLLTPRRSLPKSNLIRRKP